MALLTTEGLVLRSYGLSEADKIVVVLTPRNGLVRGVAKGARRLKSRFGSSLEPCSIVNFEFYQKEEKELLSIREADLLQSFFSHSPSAELFANFSYFAEILTLFAPPAEPNERLYNMSKLCLRELASRPDRRDAITLYFELWVLKLGGFLPDWSKCGICGRAIGARDTTSLMFSFETACEGCRGLKGAEALNPDARNLFDRAQTTGPDRFAEAAEGNWADVRIVSRILSRILEHVAGRAITVPEGFAVVLDEQ